MQKFAKNLINFHYAKLCQYCTKLWRVCKKFAKNLINFHYAKQYPYCAILRQYCAKLRHKHAKCLKCVWFGHSLSSFWHSFDTFWHNIGTFWHNIGTFWHWIFFHWGCRKNSEYHKVQVVSDPIIKWHYMHFLIKI